MKLTWQEKCALEDHFWPKEVQPKNFRMTEGDYQDMANTSIGQVIILRIRWDKFKTNVRKAFKVFK